MSAADLLQVMQLAASFGSRHGQHLPLKLTQLVSDPALHEPAFKLLLPFVVVGEFAEEEPHFVVDIAYFEGPAGHSQFVMHVFGADLGSELAALPRKQHFFDVLVPAVQSRENSAGSMSLFGHFGERLQLKDDALAQLEAPGRKVSLEEMAERNDRLLLLSLGTHFGRALQEGPVVGSFVLLQSGNAVLQCSMALQRGKVSESAVSHRQRSAVSDGQRSAVRDGHRGATSGLAHKIIGGWYRQRKEKSIEAIGLDHPVVQPQGVVGYLRPVLPPADFGTF